MTRYILFGIFISILSCTSNSLNVDQIQNGVSQCDRVIISIGKSRINLNKEDSLFLEITKLFSKENFKGFYRGNERSKQMYEIFLMRNESTVLYLTVLDNNMGALIYRGNRLIGQDILIYDSKLIEAINMAMDK